MLNSLLIRWAVALILVLATFNPTGLSFVHWAGANAQTQLPLVILLGRLLVVAYIIFLRATLRSIGFVGVALVLALVGAFLWVLTDFGVVSLENPGALTWIGLIAVSFILGLGVSWAIIRRRLSGQMDVDDVEE